MRRRVLGAALLTTAIVVSTAVSVGGSATYVALEVTTKPEFCKNCHIMEPYYDSWASSSHKDVTCVDCHYEPGLLETFEGKFKALSQLAKYATQTQGSKPWAEVSDYSCMRSGCHSSQLLEGEIQFGRVMFDHRHHLIGMRRGKTLRCTSCHSQIVQGDHLTVTTSSCFLCHFKSDTESKPINDCNLCHGAPAEDIVLGDTVFRHSDYLAAGVECSNCHGDVTRGTGDVPRERCGSCHNKQEHLERIGDVDFIHRHHVTEHSVTCLDCHLEIQHGLPTREQHGQLGQCTDCHAGTHNVAAEIYHGTGGRDVPDQPSAMYAARVTCTGCHRPPFAGAPAPPAGATFAADPLACVDCHGPGFEGLVDAWQAEVTQTCAHVQGEVEALHQRLQDAAAPAADGAEARARYDAAASNLGLVLLDRSQGVHNLPYVRSLLKQAADDAHAGWLAADPAAKRPEIAVGPRVTSRDNCTQMCHVTVDEVAVLQARGLPFDHAAHLLRGGLDCSACHAAEPHGRTTVMAADCRSCHHQNEDAETCAACHVEVAALRAQTVEGLDPVPMADVDCLSCHLGLADDGSLANIGAACEMCHAGEGRDLRQWVEDSGRPLAELESRLGQAPPALAAEARATIDALRHAGPWHNPPYAKAEAERLAAALGVPATPAETQEVTEPQDEEQR